MRLQGFNAMTIRFDADERMWSHACELLAEAERLQRQFFRLAVASAPAAWEPPADVFEDEREIVVVVAMPGVPAERVQVLHEDGALVVRGSRRMPLDAARYRLRQLEIPYGGFERRLPLPAGNYDVGRPDILQGCLVLRLRKLP
jgi:HSP20 family protein